jgi:hypothetical protein
MPVIVAAASLVTLTGCFSSSNGGPTASPEPTEVAVAQDFCGAMSIATESAALARASLSGLYDEMATDEITDPGHDLTVFTTAGTDVVAYGTGYVTAITQVRSFADATLYEDLDAISTYWEEYAIPVGQMAADAESYSAFVDASRSLIEAPETVEMRTAQIAATDNVNREYAKVCSSA